VIRFSLRTALVLAALSASSASAFDTLGGGDSYYGVKRLSLFFGPGLGSLVHDAGVEQDGIDMGWQFGFAYALSPRLRLDFYYQFTSIPIVSPSPLGGGMLASKFYFNSEAMRLVYRFDWDRALNFGGLVPYLHLGFGWYHMHSVNAQAGLDFPVGMTMPVGLGVEVPLASDRFAVHLDYSYYLLFDEEQNPGVLALLGVPEVHFNVQTLWCKLVWSFF
jgi:hypothetical protein